MIVVLIKNYSSNECIGIAFLLAMMMIFKNIPSISIRLLQRNKYENKSFREDKVYKGVSSN